MKVGHAYWFGSFTRSGPWTVHVSDNDVTRDSEVAFGQHDFRSFDGRHWDELPPAPAMPRFIDSMHGWAVGPDPKHPDPDNTMLWSTGDGGLTYEPLGFVFGGLHHAGDDGEVTFVDAEHGFATTSQLVISKWTVRRTSDGGRTWQSRSTSDEGAAPFGTPAEFEFVSPTEGYATGYTYAPEHPSVDLFRTRDAGVSWQRVGPMVSGQHGSGLPTIIGDFVLVPVLRLDPPGSRVEIYEARQSADGPWRRVWSVPVAVDAPVHWQPGTLAPSALLVDEDDGLVDLRNGTFVGVRHDQRVEVRRPPSTTRQYLGASGSSTFLWSYADGVFTSSDVGATWQRVSLPNG